MFNYYLDYHLDINDLEESAAVASVTLAAIAIGAATFTASTAFGAVAVSSVIVIDAKLLRLSARY